MPVDPTVQAICLLVQHLQTLAYRMGQFSVFGLHETDACGPGHCNAHSGSEVFRAMRGAQQGATSPHTPAQSAGSGHPTQPRRSTSSQPLNPTSAHLLGSIQPIQPQSPMPAQPLNPTHAMAAWRKAYAVRKSAAGSGRAMPSSDRPACHAHAQGALTSTWMPPPPLAVAAQRIFSILPGPVTATAAAAQRTSAGVPGSASYTAEDAGQALGGDAESAAQGSASRQQPSAAAAVKQSGHVSGPS